MIDHKAKSAAAAGATGRQSLSAPRGMLAVKRAAMARLTSPFLLPELANIVVQYAVDPAILQLRAALWKSPESDERAELLDMLRQMERADAPASILQTTLGDDVDGLLARLLAREAIRSLEDRGPLGGAGAARPALAEKELPPAQEGLRNELRTDEDPDVCYVDGLPMGPGDVREAGRNPVTAQAVWKLAEVMRAEGKALPELNASKPLHEHAARLMKIHIEPHFLLCEKAIKAGGARKRDPRRRLIRALKKAIADGRSSALRSVAADGPAWAGVQVALLRRAVWRLVAYLEIAEDRPQQAGRGFAARQRG